MRTSPRNQITLLLLILLVSIISGSTLLACPFCGPPALTLAEQMDKADAVVLAEWVSAKEGTGDLVGNTTYRVKKIHKSVKEGPKVGDDITLLRHRTNKEGDLFLLIGSLGIELEWTSPLEITKAGYQYLANSPPLKTKTVKRLPYFMKYLENKDQMVADDAFYEFANAPYKDVKLIKDQIPRDKVKQWLVNPKTPTTRIGLYGLLLGLSGNKEDAALMKNIISQNKETLRLGIDGVMTGYILITGVDGLDYIEQIKMKNLYLLDKEGKPLLDESGEKRSVPFSETYATIQALRFMWEHGDGKVSKERLRQSMRILLNRPALADLIIPDLSRWKDWSVQDKLMKLYDTEDYDIHSVKSSIIRYVLACSVDVPKNSTLPEPAHVTKAKMHLKTLEKKDPKMVAASKRFFFIDQ